MLPALLVSDDLRESAITIKELTFKTARPLGRGQDADKMRNPIL